MTVNQTAIGQAHPTESLDEIAVLRTFVYVRSRPILAWVERWPLFPFQAGLMFWFSRKKFVGSYLFLISLSL
jgi:hypothetical protein